MAFWYALSVFVTVVILFTVAGKLLENRLIHGLDQLNTAEFNQLKAHLGPDYRKLDSAEMERRVRATSESGAVLFFISIEDPKSDVRFRSHNLGSANIPDIKGRRAYTTQLAGAGAVRADEFLLPPFDVTIATSAQAARSSLREYAQIGAGLTAIMLLASAAIGYGLSHLLLRPMRAIAQTAERIGSDNLSERITVGEVRDELSELARLLNATFDRLERSFEQIRRFAHEASHELKTPLSLIRLHAERLLAAEDLPARHADALFVQIEEIERLNQIIDEMLLLSRAEANAIPIELRLQDPRLFLAAFAQDAEVLADDHDLRFVWTHEGEGLARFEGKWIRQVLLNLLSNALNASPAHGQVTLTSEIVAEGWRVSITDTGPGLPAEQRAQIFDRFVRFSRDSGARDRGSGLGLPISRSIVELHGGRIWAETATPQGGLNVTFVIPG